MNFLKNQIYYLETNISKEYILEAFKAKREAAKEEKGTKIFFIYPDYSSIGVSKDKIIVDVIADRLSAATIGEIKISVSSLTNGTSIIAETVPDTSQLTIPFAVIVLSLLFLFPILKWNYHYSNTFLVSFFSIALILICSLLWLAIVYVKNRMKYYLEIIFFYINVDGYFKLIS